MEEGNPSVAKAQPAPLNLTVASAVQLGGSLWDFEGPRVLLSLLFPSQRLVAAQALSLLWCFVRRLFTPLIYVSEAEIKRSEWCGAHKGFRLNTAHRAGDRKVLSDPVLQRQPSSRLQGPKGERLYFPLGARKR